MTRPQTGPEGALALPLWMGAEPTFLRRVEHVCYGLLCQVRLRLRAWRRRQTKA